MVSFELLFRDITTTNLSNNQNETIKSKLRDTAFSSLTSFDRNKPKNNLTKAELHALNSLKQNNDIIIQKAGKGNTAVIIDKDAYKAKMIGVISDPSKSKKLDIQNDKHLNFILDKERKLKDILKPFDKSIWFSFIYSFFSVRPFDQKLKSALIYFFMYTTIRPKVRVLINLFILYVYNNSTKN